jgi:tRNA(Ile)-lysidine synthase
MVQRADGIVQAVSRCLGVHRRLVLAVSGGVDSMVLLDAAERARGASDRIVVANFHHGTGPHATRALRLVRSVARRAGFAMEAGRATQTHADEAGWRRDRWAFLAEVARAHDAAVATAHTRDDQLETLVMRVMRGAGARGLAGLLATPSAGARITRPLLGFTRSGIERFARSHGLEWVEDPTNASPEWFRNRVRQDILPALVRADPGFEDFLWRLGERAAALRRDVESVAKAWVRTVGPGRAEVDDGLLSDLSLAGRALLWPAILAEAGIILDARGTRRIAALSATAPVGARLQVSGGYEAVRLHHSVVVGSRRAVPAVEAPLEDDTTFGSFRFRAVGAVPDEKSTWGASFPALASLRVRAWRPGDRLKGGPGRATRRIKRYLSEVRIVGPSREGWPVVVCNDEITWVPGVYRGAMTGIDPRDPIRSFVCERTDS